jgi:hypothetical protein
VIDLDVKAVPVPATLLPAALDLEEIRAISGVDLFAKVMRHLGGVERLNTRITRTPSGGLHVWFSAPTGVLIRSSKGEAHGNGHVTGLGWQIDVRAHGGYVVAPGSITKLGMYRLVRDLPAMPLPDWLAWWLATTGLTGRPADGTATPHKTATRGATHLDTGPQHVGSGRGVRIATAALADECRELAAMTTDSGRNNALNRAAYKLGGYIPDGYLTEQDVTDALTDAALSCGLGDREIARTIRSALPAGMKHPRHLEQAA